MSYLEFIKKTQKHKSPNQLKCYSKFYKKKKLNRKKIIKILKKIIFLKRNKCYKRKLSLILKRDMKNYKKIIYLKRNKKMKNQNKMR